MSEDQDWITATQRNFFRGRKEAPKSFRVLVKRRGYRDLLGGSTNYISAQLETLGKVGVNINVFIYVISF